MIPAAALFLALVRLPPPGPLDFDTRLYRLTLDEVGHASDLVQRSSGAHWLGTAPVPFFGVKAQGRWYGPSRVDARRNRVTVHFGPSGVVAKFEFESHGDYLVVELKTLQGDVEAVQLARLPTTGLDEPGWLGVRANATFAVAGVGLSPRVEVALRGGGDVVATVYREFGMLGEKVALLAAPRGMVPALLERVEKENKLPSPQLGGRWAKASDLVRYGYLFVDLSEENADEMIRQAKRAGVGAILIYAKTWAGSFGTYPINPVNFPRGEAGLLAVIRKCHAAGLRVGMHMLTSAVSRNDSLVRPDPDPRLLSDATATLAEDIQETTPVIATDTGVSGFPLEQTYYGTTAQGRSIRIDHEIIRYSTIRTKGHDELIDCIRGADGTVPARHSAGATIYHLVERFGTYLADLRTGLKGEISGRIADLVNRMGFDMVFFDCGEVNGANGPGWYWNSQQQWDIWKRIRRPVLIEGSGGTPWLWHFFTRSVSDDFATLAPKQYLSLHKIADSWETARRSFIPSELGWWGLLEDSEDHAATIPDEIEFFAARMMALDTPGSVETTASRLKLNGRSQELLDLLGRWERLRLARRASRALREKLREGEWHLTRHGGRDSVQPVEYAVEHFSGSQALMRFDNAFAAQPLKFRLRVDAQLAKPGDPRNAVLLERHGPPLLAPPDSRAAMPGNLADRIELAPPELDAASVFVQSADPDPGRAQGKPIDLTHRRALAVTLEVVGPPMQTSAPPVLNIQLESTRKTFRDYYVDLNFRGRRTVVLPGPTSERTLAEFRPAMENYSFKASMYHFDYGHILAVNVRWMRTAHAAPVRVRVRSIEALAESSARLEHPTIALQGAGVLSIPTVLDTGDYAEFWADGVIRVFSRTGALLSSWQVGEGRVPEVPSGRVGLRVSSVKGVGFGELTLITTGARVPL